MPTHEENVADPSMALIEVGGKRQWVARADLRHVGSRSVGNVRFQGMTFTKNRSLLRTFDDPEYIASLGGGPERGGASVGACCFLHGEDKRPGEIRRRQKCENLTEHECIRLGGEWLGPGTSCWIDSSNGFRICPE